MVSSVAIQALGVYIKHWLIPSNEQRRVFELNKSMSGPLTAFYYNPVPPHNIFNRLEELADEIFICGKWHDYLKIKNSDKYGRIRKSLPTPDFIKYLHYDKNSHFWVFDDFDSDSNLNRNVGAIIALGTTKGLSRFYIFTSKTCRKQILRETFTILISLMFIIRCTVFDYIPAIIRRRRRREIFHIKIEIRYYISNIISRIKFIYYIFQDFKYINKNYSIIYCIYNTFTIHIFTMIILLYGPRVFYYLLKSIT